MADESYSELLTATVEINLTTFREQMKAADVTMDALRAKMKTNGRTTTFSQAGDAIVAAGAQALVDFAEHVMVESLVEVPKHTGVLENSHNVSPPTKVSNRIKVTMGYGYGDEMNSDGRRASQYALPVHEKYEAYHDPPTKDHFLLDPLLMASSGFGPSLSGTMRRTNMVGNRMTTMVVDGKLLGTSDLGVITDLPAMSGSVVSGTLIRGAGGRFVGAKGAFRGAGFGEL